MYDIFKCARAAVYHNTRRLTAAQVMKELGCTHLVNAYYFNGSFKPLGWLIINGNKVSEDKWMDWGFSCDKTGAPKMSTDRTRNYFISCRPLLKDGSETIREDTADVARKAERTAVGWTSDGHIILWCDKTKMKMPDLIEKMRSLGAVDAMAMDGGGSTQGRFPKGNVTSSRLVPTYLAFWATNEEYEPKGDKPMIEVNAYSLKVDGEKKVSAHFKVKEFACKDGSDTVFIARDLIMVCEYIRMRCNKGITVNSAYRTPEYNKSVGGVDGSLHTQGAAVDLKTPSGYTPAKLANIARELLPDWGGVGIYDWGIHVDVRKDKADWVG